MQTYNDMPVATFSEVDALAPYLGYGDHAAERLLRMGVMNDKEELSSESITVLATVFASNFNDCFDQYYVDNFEMLDIAYGAIKSLWEKGEITGMYLYVLLCCGMIECHVPKELTWIARREDALYVYMQNFMEAMKAYDVSVEEEEIKN